MKKGERLLGVFTKWDEREGEARGGGGLEEIKLDLIVCIANLAIVY